MRLLKTITIATAMSIAGLSATSYADDLVTDDMLQKDTVVCFNNQLEDEGVLAVVGESFWSKKPNAREVPIDSQKVTCMRYRSAKEIKPFFYAASEITDEGTVVPGSKGAECRRTKGGFAKYYLLTRDENGKKRCVIDKSREEQSTREYVRGRKAL